MAVAANGEDGLAQALVDKYGDSDMITELAALHGLTADLVVTGTQRTAGSIVQTISTSGTTTTVTRQ